MCGYYRVSCPVPPAAHQQFLDGTAQAFRESIRSNYVDHDFIVSTDPVYAAANGLTDAACKTQVMAATRAVLDPSYLCNIPFFRIVTIEMEA
jgi:hypothetical protein